LVVREIFKLIIILEKEKITEDVKKKLVKNGLSLIGMSDKEIIFNKLKPHFHPHQTKQNRITLLVLIKCMRAEIERKKLDPEFEREYNLNYLSKIGIIFRSLLIDQTINRYRYS
jgi:hypothetical protein